MNVESPARVIADAAAGVTAAAARSRVVASLPGHHDLPHACQGLLRLAQRQTQVRDISKRAGPGGLDHVHVTGRAIRPRFDQS